MAAAEVTAVAEAHAAVVALIKTIPDAALDWRPSVDEWSLKQTIAHVAHAYAFYLTIIEETRASEFGDVYLISGSAGWRRIEATDSAVMQCATVAAVLDQLALTYQSAMAIFESLTPEELDRPFLLHAWRPDAETEHCTFRLRVLQTAAQHLREHQAQVADFLARWQAVYGDDS
jgi:uncharacterized damage-inducible protein DinB